MDNPLFMILQLLVAAIFGAIVGYEREVHEHPAGLRTHILVCVGAALITMVSTSFRAPEGDPGRIAAQIVSGIGFLGAGTILRQGSIVRGLTTAASLWTVAGIGIAVGVGEMIHMLMAAVATVIVFLTLSTTRMAERKRIAHNLYLEMLPDNVTALGDVLKHLSDMYVSVDSIKSLEATENKRIFKLRIVLPKKVSRDEIIQMLTNLEDLEQFEWK